MCFCGLVGRPRPLAPAVSAARAKPRPCSFWEGGGSQTPRAPEAPTRGVGWGRASFLAERQRFRYRLPWGARRAPQRLTPPASLPAWTAGSSSAEFRTGETRPSQNGVWSLWGPGVSSLGCFLLFVGVIPGPVHSINHSCESPAGFCSWGMRNVGASGPAFHTHLRARLGGVFSAAPCTLFIPLQHRQELQ